jgi:hypothetical protein
MDQTNPFKYFKQSLTAIPPAQQSFSATLGLLAFSGLNDTLLLPEICYFLQQGLKLTSCGYFWSDTAGNMRDAWCISTGILSFKTLVSCREYQESGTRTWPTFQENVLMGATAGYLLPFQNERFYASQHYRETYQAINIRHILDVVLHDGKQPHGAFLLMRSAKQGPFTPDERNFIEKLIPILNGVFTTPCKPIVQYSEKELTGFALLTDTGRYKSMSAEARRIVWSLTHIQPGSFADPNDPSIESHLEQLVAAHYPSAGSPETLAVDIENRWGRFHLYFEKEPQTLDTIVTLRRKVPLPSQLAFCLSRYNFPPMRQMVAWLLAQNHSRNDIATNLGVTVETVTSHIKLIYKETQTSSSHGLLIKLAG